MDKMKVVFQALDQELTQANLDLSIICVGGFVLEYHGLRATQDVDAFYEESHEINRIIAKIGKLFHINTREELWLNNEVANLNPAPDLEICELLYSFQSLTVYIVPLTYVMGMKIMSSREQDVLDIGKIIKMEKMTSPFETFRALKELGFENMDFSVLLEGFSYAYGLEWLERFFVENQEKLQRFF